MTLVANGNGATTFHSVTATRRCPVCEGKDGCSLADDGLIACRRRQGEQTGFVCHGPAKKDAAYTLYRKAADVHRSRFTIKRPTRPATNWPVVAERFRANLTADRAAELAADLGLPTSALDALAVGFNPDDAEGPAWTFPEVLGDGVTVCGVGRRFKDGRKKAMAGSARGLTVPVGWQDAPGPVLLPEGASDVLALAGVLGLCAVGRPSNLGGVAFLVELLRGVAASREILVLAEFDPTERGEWPGLAGAQTTAAKLAAELKRPIRWALPPNKSKDARRWLLDQPEYGGGRD